MTGVSTGRNHLYDRLPAVIRQEDARRGSPLQALLEIIQAQADVVEGDIRRLWDNLFIETCDPWVIPYLGDLVGNTPLFDASRIDQPDTAAELFPDLAGPGLIPDVAARGRADVAKTIYYRRRKGTLAMLEELARDVTGWGAHAVEFFRLLGWTQAVRNHLRTECLRTPDLRHIEALDRLDGPFDGTCHTADVRPISQLRGWHNIKNVGFFLWRLKSHEENRVVACPSPEAPAFGFHFSPLGTPAPLFTRSRREDDETAVATELHVPAPIRPAAFYEDLKAYRAAPPSQREGYTRYYGLFDIVEGSGLPQAPGASLAVFRNGDPVPPEKIRCIDLSSWRQPSEPEIVGVDVRLGRLAFSAGWEPDPAEPVDVCCHHGFGADLGGGSYAREPWLMERPGDVLVIEVQKEGAVPSLNDALAEWASQGKPNTIISMLDSRTYEEALAIEPADGSFLAIEAAGGARPHLKLSDALVISGDHPGASFTLSGLLVEGGVEIQGTLERFRLLHTTLVPGRRLEVAEENGRPIGVAGSTEPSLSAGTMAAERAELRVEIAFSITGPLRIPQHCEGLWILDSIVDGLGTTAIGGAAAGEPAPPSRLERVTILGESRFRSLTEASEVIFTAPVLCERRQSGCVRFSFLPQTSITPPAYRCQPDLEIATRLEEAEKEGGALGSLERDAIRDGVRRWLVPAFTSERYGDPAYAQLHLNAPRQIATGAEDGSEMGAFCHLKQPQREANLRLRLREYLPFGLEPGIIYVT